LSRGSSFSGVEMQRFVRRVSVSALGLVAVLATAVVPLTAGPAANAASGPSAARVGCDSTRPAVAHFSNAAPAHVRTAAPIPCTTTVGPSNETALVGVTSAGAVFYAPLIGSPAPGTDGWSPPCPTNELVGRSTNLGKTWTQLDPAGPRTSGCAPAMLTVDPQTSRVWFPTSLALSGVCGAHILWSDDGGGSWVKGSDIPCPGQGGQKLLEGPPPSAGPRPVGYPHVVYWCANAADGLTVQVLECYKSLDGGKTFSAVFADPEGGGGAGGHPDPDLAPGCANQTARPGGVTARGVLVFPTIECGVLGAAISRDEGATWQFVSNVATGVEDVMPTSSAVDRAGNVYFAYRNADGLPYLVVSKDDGAHWGAPMMVAPPGVKKIQRVAVSAGKRGEVVLAYLGTASSPLASGYITESSNVLSAKPLFWSASVNAPSRPLINVLTPPSFSDRFFYLSAAIGPDGTPWAGFQCASTDACQGQRIGIVGRLALPT
jgi:hypothetical protein